MSWHMMQDTLYNGNVICKSIRYIIEKKTGPVVLKKYCLYHLEVDHIWSSSGMRYLWCECKQNDLQTSVHIANYVLLQNQQTCFRIGGVH
jgi:hypothetical protein